MKDGYYRHEQHHYRSPNPNFCLNGLKLCSDYKFLWPFPTMTTPDMVPRGWGRRYRHLSTTLEGYSAEQLRLQQARQAGASGSTRPSHERKPSHCIPSSFICTSNWGSW